MYVVLSEELGAQRPQQIEYEKRRSTGQKTHAQYRDQLMQRENQHRFESKSGNVSPVKRIANLANQPRDGEGRGRS